MLVSSADDARAPGASKLATLVNHSPARVEKRREKKGEGCTPRDGSSILILVSCAADSWRSTGEGCMDGGVV